MSIYFKEKHFMKLSLFITILFIILNFSLEHCGFDEHKIKSPRKYEEENDYDLRFLQDQAYAPIRIYFDYATLENQTAISEADKNNIKLILNNAGAVFQNLIKVKRLTSNAIITDCDSSVTPSNLVQTTGVAADLVIFPFIDTTVTGNTEAYASACIISRKNNRPVAGLIAFTLKLNTTRSNWLQYYTSLAIHELTHVLVFNPDMFGMFIDSNGKTIPQANVMTTQMIQGVQRSFIITPKVVQAAQKYFNCSNIIGVELENQGGTGTATSHWEARVMLSDYMIGVSYDEMSISEITLAFFEDSGWYQANYYTGGLFRYGKNGGCNFLNNKCVLANGGIEYTNEFCNTKYAPSCTASKSTKGICYITTYSTNIDSNYRYYPNFKTGGLQLADFCPITEVPTNNTAFFPWSCSQGFGTYPQQYEENISNDSACFMSSLINNNYISQLTSDYLDPRSICYQYACDFQAKAVTVTVGSSSVICPIAGGYVTLNGYTGKLLCPDFNNVCTSATRCANLIDCAINRILPVDSVYNYVKNSDVFNITATYVEITPNTTFTNSTGLNDSYNKPLTTASGSSLEISQWVLANLFLIVFLF